MSNKSISRTGIAQFFCSPSEATNCSTRNSLAPAKLIGFVALTFLAFGTHTVESLALLTAVDLALLVLFRVGRRSIWRLIKIFLWQTAIIVFLYILRFGSFAGFLSGIETSWQLSLAYLPGVLLVETTPQPRIMRILSSVVHYRTAFVAATCLKFVPLVMEEIRSIHEGQLFRGARVLPRDLLRPWNWPDLVHCLVVPAIIHSMKLAGEIALAARARDFGAKSTRTNWPGT